MIALTVFSISFLIFQDHRIVNRLAKLLSSIKVNYAKIRPLRPVAKLQNELQNLLHDVNNPYPMKW